MFSDFLAGKHFGAKELFFFLASDFFFRGKLMNSHVAMAARASLAWSRLRRGLARNFATSSRWRLDGATAIVTGGTKGIGRACVEAVGGLGARVVTWYSCVCVCVCVFVYVCVCVCVFVCVNERES